MMLIPVDLQENSFPETNKKKRWHFAAYLFCDLHELVVVDSASSSEHNSGSLVMCIDVVLEILPLKGFDVLRGAKDR